MNQKEFLQNSILQDKFINFFDPDYSIGKDDSMKVRDKQSMPEKQIIRDNFE